MKISASSIEPLEPRIAPAAAVNVLTNTTATYTDVDGDHVTIKVSAGDLHGAGIFAVISQGSGDQLQLVNFSAGGFDGADLTFSVTKAPGGDGLANVGKINSTNHDLGRVTVKGDLGAIDAGDATTATPGLKSLTVQSLGALSVSTQQPAGDLNSDILGALGSLKVKGDLRDAYIHVTGGADGKIGPITIGGSMIGAMVPGPNDRPGSIESSGDIGAVKIGRDIVGVNFASGFLQSDSGKIKSVTLGGSLIGGPGQFSGEIRSGNGLGPVKIAGNVAGGTGATSGFIASDTGFGPDDGGITSITIGGSLIGGAGVNRGAIRSPGDVGPVKIGRDAQGGSGDESGKMDVLGKVTSLRIGGSVIGSSGDYDTIPGHLGQIFIRHGFDSLTVGGSIVGGAGGFSAEIGSALGGAMGAIKIGHDVVGGVGFESAFIISGFGGIKSVTIGGSLVGGAGDFSGGVTSGNGGIGPVKIARDLRGGTGFASGEVVTGATFNDIASVSIGGSLIGGPNSGSGEIAARNVGKVVIGGDLIGGSITGTAISASGMGFILASQHLGPVTIGGSIISGVDDSTGGDLLDSGAIRADDDIASLTVKGSLIGHPDTGKGASLVTISARGQNQASPALSDTRDIAIGSITIAGHVEWANILAGYDHFGTARNADAQIRAVKVGGDWIASSLVAGAKNSGEPNFGDGNDVKISGGGVKDTSDATLLSRIASITIKGQVIGSSAASDHFGFVAQQVGSFKAAGFAVALTSGTDGFIPLSLSTGADAAIHEI